MIALATASMVFFLASCSAAGLRLLWLAARRRRAAELLCGAGFTAIPLLGIPLSLASGAGSVAVGETSLGLYLAGTASTSLGLCAFFAFTWRTFRPSEAWARRLAIGAMAALWASWAWSGGALWAAEAATASRAVTAGAMGVLLTLSVLCFAWTAAESFEQARMSARRVALGLGDPVVTHRFALWALHGASTALLTAVFAGAHAAGLSPADPAVGVAAGLLGALGGGAVLLAFLPPRWYLGWVEAGAQAA